MFTKENQEILWTRDYDSFSLYDKNRDINLKGVGNKIEESLKENGWLASHPMIVDGDLNIRDGQHRFIIAKKLGIEIPVLIDKNFDDEKMISINNASRAWSLTDFLHYHAKNGNGNAQKFLKIYREAPLSLETCCRLAGIQGTKMRNANYVFPQICGFELQQRINRLLEVIEAAKMQLLPVLQAAWL